MRREEDKRGKLRAVVEGVELCGKRPVKADEPEKGEKTSSARTYGA